MSNALPTGYDVAQLAAIFRKANHELRLNIPTAVGFCMSIRRDCFDDVGIFDEALFARGDGEENDFCLRAVKRGWRNVLAAVVERMKNARSRLG